jgi:hypothetical protein
METRTIGAITHRLILEVTFTTWVTNGTLRWMVGKEEPHGAFPEHMLSHEYDSLLGFMDDGEGFHAGMQKAMHWMCRFTPVSAVTRGKTYHNVIGFGDHSISIKHILFQVICLRTLSKAVEDEHQPTVPHYREP